MKNAIFPIVASNARSQVDEIVGGHLGIAGKGHLEAFVKIGDRRSWTARTVRDPNNVRLCLRIGSVREGTARRNGRRITEKLS